MIEIFILIALGRWLYALATKFDKPNKWIYPLFAVLTYYGVGISSVILMVLIAEMSGSFYFNDMNAIVLGLFGIPCGVGAVWLLHFLLGRAWSKQKSEQIDENSLLDAEITENDL